MNSLCRLFVSLLLCSISAFSIASEGFLADRHSAKGIACAACHSGAVQNKVDSKVCLSCHGGSYAKLAESTDSGDMNYHETHLGELPCSDCHHGHTASVLACNQCHQFKAKVP